MGNSNSQIQGGIYVQTDSPFYIAGDTVTGKVHINLLQTKSVNMIQLSVKGYEEIYWKERHTRQHHHTESNGQRRTTTETYYETHAGKTVFFCHKFPLYIWSNFSYMPAGQYTFPFQFKLPEGLPGSFYENGNHNGGDYKSIIKYKVKGFIETNSSKVLKGRQEIIVREPLKTMVSAQYGEKTVKPTTCCCISQGESKISCHFERNSYLPGETAKILVDLDNSNCNLAVKNLRCNFIKRLHLVSNRGKELIIQRTIQTRQFGGVRANEKAINENRKFCEIVLTQQNGNLFNPQQKDNFVIVKGCTCCSSLPEVTIPISIVSPPPINYGVVSAPPNWQPQVFEVRTFAFNSEFNYNNAPSDNVNIQMNIPPPMNPPVMNVQVNFSPQQQFSPPPSQYPPPPVMETNTNPPPHHHHHHHHHQNQGPPPLAYQDNFQNQNQININFQENFSNQNQNNLGFQQNYQNNFYSNPNGFS